MQTADFVATIFDNATSSPGKVTVGLTMALNALKMGHSAVILLMVDGVELAVPGAMEAIDIGAPFRPAADLLADFLAAGGRIAVCSACLVHHGMSADQVVPGYEVINAPDVVAALMAAKGTLQLS
ncbi:DsrE family protein [Paenirhodobacter enshiensis]|uniref:DsrE family protein n=1 Tax=Paenirhodobacter enshiensis TaxID=1105367 RepID=UPI003FA244E8